MPRMVGATEVVALMVLDAKLLQRIREHVGYRAEFTTPLLEGPMAAQQTVWLYHASGVLYIKVFGRSLRLAEAIPAADDADILYFVDRLGRALPLRQMRLHLGGPRAKALRKIVGRRFKRVVGES
ncbi:MAG: hypothetical protein K2J53_03675 [Alistipes sp.]|nr:hypothetical protein [Alistipes sp.]